MKKLSNFLHEPELLAGMQRVARIAQSTPDLHALAVRLAELLYQGDAGQLFWEHYVQHKEYISKILGNDADCYLAYVYELAFPRLMDLYTKAGYPESVLADTMADIDLRAQNYRLMFGHGGIDNYHWLIHHMTGNLFTLGRLQFIFTKKAPAGSCVYQNLERGDLFAVAQADVPVDAEGFIAAKDESPSFITTLTQTPGGFTAHPIDARGAVLPQPIEISTEKNACILHSGDAVIDIHIPATGKMTAQDCTASFEQAVEFAKRFFPGIDYRGFYCCSWLLADELLDGLSPTSNIPAFSRRFIRCAAHRSDHELIYKWVFGMDKEPADYREHTATTSLQKLTHSLLSQNRWFTTRAGYIPLRSR